MKRCKNLEQNLENLMSQKSFEVEEQLISCSTWASLQVSTKWRVETSIGLFHWKVSCDLWKNRLRGVEEERWSCQFVGWTEKKGKWVYIHSMTEQIVTEHLCIGFQCWSKPDIVLVLLPAMFRPFALCFHGWLTPFPRHPLLLCY